MSRRKFSAEYREEAVKMVIESSRPIAEVARELGLNEGTLGNWVNAYRQAHAGDGLFVLEVGAGSTRRAVSEGL